MHLFCQTVANVFEHIIGYLKLKHNLQLAFDSPYPSIDFKNFREYDWIDFYEDAVEAIRGNEVDLCIFVDSNHAGNKSIRRSRTGFMIHMNISLIS